MLDRYRRSFNFSENLYNCSYQIIEFTVFNYLIYISFTGISVLSLCEVLFFSWTLFRTMVKDFKKKFRMFALANGFDVPKFMEEDPEEMDDDVRHVMKQNKIASKHNKEQIQRIYVRLSTYKLL